MPDAVAAPQEAPPPAAERILAAVRAIPPGTVSSYGQVALRAGLPRRARLVARTLAHADIPDLPWHRVVRADGSIAFPPGSRGFREQCARLRAEGVTVRNGRVAMPASTETSLDAILWGPG